MKAVNRIGLSSQLKPRDREPECRTAPPPPADGCDDNGTESIQNFSVFGLEMTNNVLEATDMLQHLNGFFEHYRKSFP